MSVSSVFIKRPVATALLTLALCVGGAVAYTLLPVASLPQVDFPTISVRASLPGASPETMATSVATPLERSLGTIAGITEMTSSSSMGSTRIVIQFDLSRDINGAARDVQAAINAAMGNLPTSLPNAPTYNLVNPADSPILMIGLTSDTLYPHQLYDLASTLLAPKIAQVDGVGEADAGGGSLPAVRVEVNNDMLHHYGLAMNDVRAAIQAANPNMAVGAIEDGSRYWQIETNSRLTKAADFAPLVVAWRDSSPVLLSDVASVTDSVQDVNNVGFANGKPGVMLVVFKKPGANVIATVDAVKATLPRLRALIPPDVQMTQIYDSTNTIRASLDDVTRTLIISVCLVVLVVFFFLLSARATLIPGIAVGASLIGTFAGMYFCGFSLDNLSLMALAVATGFVVDDAIVVLENTSRHLEDGLPPLEAALTGSKEVSFTVFSISLSLIAVFIPILLMQGLVGRLFREFAVTLSLAIMVSLVLSLTLTPMLCAKLLKAPRRSDAAGDGTSGRARRAMRGAMRKIAAFQEGVRAKYDHSLQVFLRHKRWVLILWFCTVGLTVHMYIAAPKGFFPQQDTGMIRGALRSDQSISFKSLRVKLAGLMEAARKDPAVESVAGYTGASSSAAFITIGLKPRDQRDVTADQVIARLRPLVSKDPAARLYMSATQDIRVGGRSSRAAYQYTMQGDDLAALRTWSNALQAAMTKDHLFKDVNSDLQDRGLEARIVVDRDTASRLGVSMSQVDAALGQAFGQSQSSTMYRSRNQYRVILIAEPRHWLGPEGLNSVYVPSSDGRVVPLSAFAYFDMGASPTSVSHQGQTAAVTVSFNLSPDVSLSQATQRIEQIKGELGMPPSIVGSFQGTAKVFQQSLSSQPWLILAAVVCLYIVLGVLYESCVHPITILSTLPPAGIGALIALRLFDMDFSVIALIGVLLLAGIVKKNAIMLIDFAIVAEREEGLSPAQSIARACSLRFRPIMMTTMAAILGAVPLAIGFGDGSELRRPLGVSIIGGLVLSQLLTLYTTPVLYLYMDGLGAWWKRRFKAGRQETQETDLSANGAENHV